MKKILFKKLDFKRYFCTSVPREATDLVESLESSIKRNPNKPLFNFKDSQQKWNSLTYSEFGTKVKHFKNALKKLGI